MKARNLPLLALVLVLTGCQTMSNAIITSLTGDSDSAQMDRSTRYYENKGQDSKSARDNAYYDFVWAHSRFPEH